MASITCEHLQEQLEHTKVEREHAFMHICRCDGVIQLLEHLIREGADDAPDTIISFPEEGAVKDSDASLA